MCMQREWQTWCTSTKLGTQTMMAVLVARADLIRASSVTIRAGDWGLKAVITSPHAAYKHVVSNRQ